MADLAELGFEDGTTDEFTSIALGASEFTVSAASAMGGTINGLSVGTDTRAIATKTIPSVGSDTELHCRVYIDVNDLTIANPNSHDLMVLQDLAPTTQLFKVLFGFSVGQQLYMRTTWRGDGQTFVANRDINNLTAGAHWYEWVMIKASTDVASDGIYRIYQDDVMLFENTGVDIFDGFAGVDDFRIDTSGIDASTTGSVFIDQIKIATQDTLIGPMPSVAGQSTTHVTTAVMV